MALPAILGTIGALSSRSGAAGLAGGALNAAGAISGGASSGSFAAMTKQMNVATRAGQKLSDAIGQVTGPLNQVASGFAGLPTSMTAVVQLMGSMKSAVSALGETVAPFVKMANPALVQRFMLAVDDLTAVMGHSLMPVMEFATKQVRAFADAFMVLMGPLNRFVGMILKEVGGMLDALMRAFEPVLYILAKFIDLCTAMLRPLMQVMAIMFKIAMVPFEAVMRVLEPVLDLVMSVFEVVAKIFGDIIGWFEKLIDKGIQWVRDLFGITTIGQKSVGAAVRPATFQSIEDYGRSAQTAAFSLGTAASPEAETANTTKMIYEFLTTKLPEIVMAAAKAIIAGAVDEADKFGDKYVPGYQTGKEALRTVGILRGEGGGIEGMIAEARAAGRLVAPEPPPAPPV